MEGEGPTYAAHNSAFSLKTNTQYMLYKRRSCHQSVNVLLKGLSHEIDFKNFDKKLQNLAYLRDAAGF